MTVNATLQHLLGLFAYTHLPDHLQSVSKPFHLLAHRMVKGLARDVDTIELEVGLRKLIEAKDCCVRQAVANSRWESK